MENMFKLWRPVKDEFNPVERTCKSPPRPPNPPSRVSDFQDSDFAPIFWKEPQYIFPPVPSMPSSPRKTMSPPSSPSVTRPPSISPPSSQSVSRPSSISPPSSQSVSRPPSISPPSSPFVPRPPSISPPSSPSVPRPSSISPPSSSTLQTTVSPVLFVGAENPLHSSSVSSESPQISPIISPKTASASSLQHSKLQTFNGIPCKVCGDKSNGVHYGVISCKGCKGFFRRYLSLNVNFKCSESKNCDLYMRNRIRCPYCRLQKCLNVGMSRNGIKCGRMTKEQKARIEEEAQYCRISRERSCHSADTVTIEMECDASSSSGDNGQFQNINNHNSLRNSLTPHTSTETVPPSVELQQQQVSKAQDRQIITDGSNVTFVNFEFSELLKQMGYKK